MDDIDVIYPTGANLKKLLVFFTALMIGHAAYAAELFATVDGLSGAATVSDQSGPTASIQLGQKIYEGQTINTGAEGEVHLVTEDSGMIAVRPDTIFRVDQYQAGGSSDDRIFMSLFKGAVRSITGWIGKYNSEAYRITTPEATIGVRGTDHETTVIENDNGDGPGTYDTVNEGRTVLKTQHGEAEVQSGKFAYAEKGKAAAPVFLAQRPRFFAMRRLRIEERVQQRKEFLRSRMEKLRENRIQRLKTIKQNRVLGEHQQQEHAKRVEETRRARIARRHQEKQAERHIQERRQRDATKNNAGNEEEQHPKRKHEPEAHHHH